MASKNLWGDLSELEKVRSPKTLLLEQAQQLTSATEGVLVGNVASGRSGRGQFDYDLDICVPGLNNYVYTVLSIVHDVDLYPVDVRAAKPDKSFSCDDEQEFEVAIEFILQSAEVKRVISRLLSQVT